MTDFVRVPADSAGKRINTNIHNDGVNDIYTSVVHVGDRLDPDKHQSVNNKGEAKVTFDGGSPDFTAFGRTTISEANMLDVFKFYHREYADKFEYVTAGTATVTHDTVFRGMKLTTGTALGDKAELTSHRFFHYRPGNTITALFTMKGGDSGQTNLNRKAGWITPTDGIYLEMDDFTIYAVIRNGNLATETRIPISSWSGDRLDGAGGDNNLSGATLDPTKNSIWWIDFQFLGAGAIRFGTYVDGQKVLCHTMGNYGILDRPYLKDASLPFCVIQENLGITSSSSEMHVFCVVIYNDGYDDQIREPVVVSAQKIVTTTTFVPILSLRPKQLNTQGEDNRIRLVPSAMSALAEGGAIELLVDVNPTLVGSTFALDVSNTNYDTAATGVGVGQPKLGQVIASGFSESIDMSESFPINRGGVTRDLDITASSHITVCARLLSAGSATVAVSINALEIE
jgi:hypothetical protein